MSSVEPGRGADVAWTDLTADERAVLAVLARQYLSDLDCLFSRTIAADAELPIDRVLPACRSLRAKGLAEYHSPVFDLDGNPAGSGYACSLAGHALVRALPPQEKADA